MGTFAPFLKSASLKKRKQPMSSDKKKTAKISKKWNRNICRRKKNYIKKKSCHLVPKVVIDLSFEGRKVEGSQKNIR